MIDMELQERCYGANRFRYVDWDNSPEFNKVPTSAPPPLQ